MTMPTPAATMMAVVVDDDAATDDAAGGHHIGRCVVGRFLESIRRPVGGRTRPAITPCENGTFEGVRGGLWLWLWVGVG
jgi:hypothetical protein